jgi:hypothetical protein
VNNHRSGREVVWAWRYAATLETAVPELPAGFDNRLGDNWRLMLGIANQYPGIVKNYARRI